VPFDEHGAPNRIVPVVVEGAVAISGAIHAPEAVIIHVAGKPRETHDENEVVEAAAPATGTQIMDAEPPR
jgi:hypothetical protein